MILKFSALPTNSVRKLQAGGFDANGQTPEVTKSDGSGNPCRHCLKEIPEGNAMLVLAYRPFPSPQPYAELGPIFLCAEQCERHPDTSELPCMFTSWEIIMIRGYDKDDRIVYGTGRVVPMKEATTEAAVLLGNKEVAYIHMRSASYNCYQAKIEKM